MTGFCWYGLQRASLLSLLISSVIFSVSALAEDCALLTRITGEWRTSYYLNPDTPGLGTGLKVSSDDLDGTSRPDLLLEQTLWDFPLLNEKGIRVSMATFDTLAGSPPMGDFAIRRSEDIANLQTGTKLTIDTFGDHIGITARRRNEYLGILHPANSSSVERSVAFFNGLSGDLDVGLSLTEDEYHSHPNNPDTGDPLFFPFFRWWDFYCNPLIPTKIAVRGRSLHAMDINGDGIKEAIVGHFGELLNDSSWCLWNRNPVQFAGVNAYQLVNHSDGSRSYELLHSFELPQTLAGFSGDGDIPQSELIIADPFWNMTALPSFEGRPAQLLASAPLMSVADILNHPGLFKIGAVVHFNPLDGTQSTMSSTYFGDSQLGESLEYIGVFPSDYPVEGQPDNVRVYAAGAPYAPAIGLFPGLPDNFRAGHVTLVDETGAQQMMLFGDAADQRFGSSVAAAGDVNADSYPDFLVGAPGGNYARLISGRSGAELVTINGPGGSDFGYKVGVLDTSQGKVAVITAPREKSAGQFNGAVYFYDISACGASVDPGQSTSLNELLEGIIEQSESLIDQIIEHILSIQGGSVPNLAAAPPELESLRSHVNQLSNVIRANGSLFPLAVFTSLPLLDMALTSFEASYNTADSAKVKLETARDTNKKIKKKLKSRSLNAKKRASLQKKQRKLKKQLGRDKAEFRAAGADLRHDAESLKSVLRMLIP